MVPEGRVAVAVEMGSHVRKRLRSSPLRAVDLLLLGYLGVVSVVAALRAPVQPGCWWLLLAHALFVLLLFLVTRPGLGPFGRTMRELYPLFLLPGLYSEL